MTRYIGTHNISARGATSNGSTFTDGINTFFDAMIAAGWLYKSGVSRYVKSNPVGSEHLISMPQASIHTDHYEITPETVFFHPTFKISVSIKVSILKSNYGVESQDTVNIAQFIFKVGTGYDVDNSTMTGVGIIEETRRYFTGVKDFHFRSGVTTNSSTLPIRAYQSESATWVQSENFITSVGNPQNKVGKSLGAFAFLKSRNSHNLLYITTPRVGGNLNPSGQNIDFTETSLSYDYPAISDAWLIIKDEYGNSSGAINLGAKGFGQIYEANNHGGELGSAFFGNVFTTASGELDVFDAYIAKDGLGASGDTVLISDPIYPQSIQCINTPFFGNANISLPGSPNGVATNIWLPWG